MDLRTIMNSDAAPNPPPRPSPTQPSAPDPIYQRPQHAFAATSPGLSPSAPNPPGYSGLPPQPLPHPSPDRSSSYGSIQSPYQHNSALPLSAGAQSQRGQSPPSTSTTFAPASRDQYYNQQQQQQHRLSFGPPIASPYAPQVISAGIQQQDQQSYFTLQRSHSFQESPHSAVSQQALHSQQFSPTRRSVSSTPLGPPSTPYARPSPQSSRPRSSGQDSHTIQFSNSEQGQEIPSRDQANNMISPSAKTSLPTQDSRQVGQTSRHHSAETERERTASVSPRTVFTSASRQGSIAGNPEHTSSPWSRQGDMRSQGSPNGSARAASHPVAAAPQTNSSPSPRTVTSNDATGGEYGSTLPRKAGVSPEPRKNSVPHPPKRKKMRYSEPPIFARKSARTKGRCPVIPNPRPPIPKNARSIQQEAWPSRKMSSPSVVSAVKSHPETGPSANSPAPRPPPPVALQDAPLVFWEPSITGFIPYEEITKLICDFLFQHVVLRKDAAASSAGIAAADHGPIVEVEAKLGRLIDMDRGDRLRLPVLTETVVNREDPRLRTSFESSMTLEQHRMMNNFLNEAVKASMPHSNPKRMPISYAHKKERDTFYEVSPNELPPVIRQNLHPRHKPRVRVTTDQRTGEIIAKIVKCRVADMDVYSPRTYVDWRISVNLEMEYDGDVRHLPVLDGMKGGRGGERNKDRMSYRHQAYQIDLTQVAKSEPPAKSDFYHELEIEVSAAEIRHRGQLALAGDPKNQYEELIKGFVDNVRVLARTVPP
ncbi:hypothetical protein MAP00_008840 [Monascus purpureus]|nr:hypothetical protein MAP00_008840 [Monascus purpureus]